jgi:hypothetical protein
MCRDLQDRHIWSVVHRCDVNSRHFFSNFCMRVEEVGKSPKSEVNLNANHCFSHIHCLFVCIYMYVVFFVNSHCQIISRIEATFAFRFTSWFRDLSAPRYACASLPRKLRIHVATVDDSPNTCLEPDYNNLCASQVQSDEARRHLYFHWSVNISGKPYLQRPFFQTNI